MSAVFVRRRRAWAYCCRVWLESHPNDTFTTFKEKVSDHNVGINEQRRLFLCVRQLARMIPVEARGKVEILEHFRELLLDDVTDLVRIASVLPSEIRRACESSLLPPPIQSCESPSPSPPPESSPPPRSSSNVSPVGSLHMMLPYRTMTPSRDERQLRAMLEFLRTVESTLSPEDAVAVNTFLRGEDYTDSSSSNVSLKNRLADAQKLVSLVATRQRLRSASPPPPPPLASTATASNTPCIVALSELRPHIVSTHCCVSRQVLRDENYANAMLRPCNEDVRCIPSAVEESQSPRRKRKRRRRHIGGTDPNIADLRWAFCLSLRDEHMTSSLYSSEALESIWQFALESDLLKLVPCIRSARDCFLYNCNPPFIYLLRCYYWGIQPSTLRALVCYDFFEDGKSGGWRSMCMFCPCTRFAQSKRIILTRHPGDLHLSHQATSHLIRNHHYLPLSYASRNLEKLNLKNLLTILFANLSNAPNACLKHNNRAEMNELLAKFPLGC